MGFLDLDEKIVRVFSRYAVPLARFAIFIVFFWFGILKMLGLSPATPFVESLFELTISFISFETFIVLFGVLEMVIGMLFLIPRATRVVIPLLFLHMVTTAMPLIMLPETAWSGFFVPTLEGQYIIKNLLIIACAFTIAGSIKPIRNEFFRN